MITAKIRAGAAAALALGVAAALTGCASSDPLDDGASASSDSKTIVVGSQQYYSNEIIAELYAQALEAKGFDVERNFNIGQREVYVPQLEKGKIDVMPEYSGNLLQYFDKDSDAKTADEIDEGLEQALPDGLRVLDEAEATDQDSYTVTKEFSEDNDVTSLADLKDVEEKLTVGANSEFQTRPYGPEGLDSVYGVQVGFKSIEDSGGALTVKALKDDTVQLANIYTSDPSIKANDFVSLEDPENLILPQNVIPVVSDKVDEQAADAIDAVNEKLTADALIDLNTKSTVDKEKASQIAEEFLKDEGLVS
ncbi:ABC transporter substrate-binding protein [Curtobacterium oceanosedimentum]|uniref:ABC transporter substrate-binding protein n=1 Tax=Curtobacterium oceanosedimentum TaxID=465820 RepID=UPI001CE21F12|nr:ABC transporter substrate-binding protein [Curtobacterium oceanosedimentum]MCA5923650.1 ABC transporter substrate-binding protein [Curtobacterium oceanosedimentum]